MSPAKYSLSFTAGGLLYHESVKMASLYLEVKDWDKVYLTTINNNLLQAKAVSSLKRISSELISRLKPLSLLELNYFVNANYQEQLYFLWILICRRYSFIGDFAKEVIREHYLIMRTTVTYDDFSVFYLHKAEFHSELEEISEATKGKLRQVLFKIAKDVGILTKDNIVIPVQPTKELAKIILESSAEDLKFFPLYDSYIENITEQL